MKFIKLIIFLLFLVATAFSIYFLNNLRNKSIDDSSAVYGGRDETGYNSAGFLITQSFSQGESICGFTLLSNKFGITAAHCLDNVETAYLGIGNYTNDKNLLPKSNSFVQLNNWDRKTSKYDLGIIELQDQQYSESQFAQISFPEVGCKYRIVGYGRTESDGVNLNSVRPRKSTTVCIDKIDETLVTLSGKGGGVCIGDSGSPIFEEGTNNIVAVMSSIKKPPNSNADPCFIGNIGYAVRVDVNRVFLAENTDIPLPNFEDAPTTEIITEVVEEDTSETSAPLDEGVFSRQNQIILGVFVASLLSTIIYLIKRLHSK